MRALWVNSGSARIYVYVKVGFDNAMFSSYVHDITLHVCGKCELIS